MAGRLRSFLWRHQAILATVYLILLIGGCLALISYALRLPRRLDIGLTVVARSVLYQRTFREVDRARDAFASGDFTSSETRLTRFLDRHDDVQPGQLQTHAVTAAHELLAETYLAQGRAGKATRLLEDLTRHTPLDYRAWLLKATAARTAGDIETSLLSFRQAFKLAPNHPGVAESYLSLLSELNDHEQILWVEDQFERAARRGSPLLTLKVGRARSPLQRRLLEWAGIEVEHGNYHGSLELANLPNGAEQRLSLPPDLFASWPRPPGSLYLQLRFENVYEELRIDALRYLTKNGESRDYTLTPQTVRYQHRPHSGVEYYAEIRTDIDVDDIESMELFYSAFPESRLSAQAHAIIEKARVNRLAQPNQL